MKNICLSFLIVVSFSLALNAMQQGQENKTSEHEKFIQPPCMGQDTTNGGQSSTCSNQQAPYYEFGGATHFYPVYPVYPVTK